MTHLEYKKIIYLLKHGALQGIDIGRLDGKCEDVIPLEDAIAVIDLVYKANGDVIPLEDSNAIIARQKARIENENKALEQKPKTEW